MREERLVVLDKAVEVKRLWALLSAFMRVFGACYWDLGLTLEIVR